MKKEKVENISFGKRIRNMATNLDGALGGLLTIWKEAFKANIIFDKGNILLINFFNSKTHDRWFIINIYAPNTKNGRRLFWNKICNLMTKLGDPKGIIMGDFNTPLFPPP